MIYNFQGGIWVHSRELYAAVGKPKDQYTRWIRYHVINNFALEEGVDYKKVPESLSKNREFVKKNHFDFYLSPTTALAVCFQKGTPQAKKVKREIEKETNV